MPERVVTLPGPAHPITFEENPARIVIHIGGRIVASSIHVLTLREASYAPVHYVPRADIDMAVLERSVHRSYCPYKGETMYFGIKAGCRASLGCRVVV